MVCLRLIEHTREKRESGGLCYMGGWIKLIRSGKSFYKIEGSFNCDKGRRRTGLGDDMRARNFGKTKVLKSKRKRVVDSCFWVGSRKKK